MTALLTAGLGLKPQHYADALDARAAGLWFEVHAENYLVAGGPRLQWLERIAERHPVSLHGVGLSLAGDVPPDPQHLAALVRLVQRVEPALVSEHLAWSRHGGAYLPDLLPVPRSHEALLRLADNIDRAQTALGRRIAVENPSHYLALAGHDYGETDFLGELVRRTGCGLLVDVNNVFVSANNLGLDPFEWIDAVPAHAVLEVHLAGHSRDPQLGESLLIDSHDAPVAPPVWALFERLIARIGPRPSLIERDAELPEFSTLMGERRRAQTVLEAAPWQEAA